MRTQQENFIIKKGDYTDSVPKMIKFTKKEKVQYEKQLAVYAQGFLNTNFNLDLEIPIEINGRLTKTGGYFQHARGKKMPLKISISERFMVLALVDKEEGMHAILDIVKHELVHYALYMLDKNYKDGQDDFENTLALLDIGASGATSENAIKTTKRNVWYNIYDVYVDAIMGKVYRDNHATKAKSWVGKRVAYEIVKTYF